MALNLFKQKFTAVIIILCMTAHQAMGQSVTGRVVDESLQPIPFVNIIMQNRSDSSFICGTVTGEDGRFTIKASTSETILRLSCIGYKTTYVNAGYDAGHSGQTHDMGNITMTTENRTLGAVVVKGRIPVHKMTAGGMITTVSNTPLEKLGTVSDVLEKVPGVIRNGKTFEVFGKGEPLIYINKRQLQDKSELERLKSEDIKSIEVITSPGSRYEATVKSVIKIYTKKETGDGFGIEMQSAYYQSENTDLSELLNLKYRHGGLDIFGNIAYSINNGTYRSSTDTHVTADTIWDQAFVQKANDKQHTVEWVTGMNYAFNTKHSAGMRYTLTLTPRSRKYSTLYSDIMADGTFFDRLDNNACTYGKNRPAHAINVYYTGQIGKAEIDFNGDYMSTTSREQSEYYELSSDHDDRTVTTFSSKKSEMLAFKLSMSYPVFGGGLTAGTEYIHTSRDDEYQNIQQYIPSSMSYIKETHLAPFTEYSHDLGKRGNIMAGIRYESVAFDYFENHNHISEQSRTFGNIFPTISLSVPAGPVNLQLAYTTRTRRPAYWQLSNNVEYGNRFLLQSGNSTLRPEYIHDVSFTGLWKFLQLSLSYNDRRDAVITWAEQLEQNNAVSKFTYINIPTLKSMSVSAVFSHSIGIWMPQIMAGMTKQWLNLSTDIGTYVMNTPTWQFSMSHTLRLAQGWIVSADAWMRTKGHSENFRSVKNVGAVNISITKWMLKNRLSIQIKGKDILKTLKSKYESYAGRIHTWQGSSYDSREIMLKVIYRLNKTNSRYKGTGAGNEEKNRL